MISINSRQFNYHITRKERFCNQKQNIKSDIKMKYEEFVLLYYLFSEKSILPAEIQKYQQCLCVPLTVYTCTLKKYTQLEPFRYMIFSYKLIVL